MKLSVVKQQCLSLYIRFSEDTEYTDYPPVIAYKENLFYKCERGSFDNIICVRYREIRRKELQEAIDPSEVVSMVYCKYRNKAYFLNELRQVVYYNSLNVADTNLIVKRALLYPKVVFQDFKQYLIDTELVLKSKIIPKDLIYKFRENATPTDSLTIYVDKNGLKTSLGDKYDLAELLLELLR